MILARHLTAIVFFPPFLGAQEPARLPGTEPLTWDGDLSARMVAGIDRFLMREIERSVGERAKLWRRDSTSREAYHESVEPNRRRFRKRIGAVDPRLPAPAVELISTSSVPSRVAEDERITVHAVRWPVFEGVHGEGLLLEPRLRPLARVVALPDADQTPEAIAGLAPGLPAEFQFARALAENGCRVLVPVLIDRRDDFSGNPAIGRMTNQPHREWIYRQAFEMGRHVIGYEVEKVLAAVDWFARAEEGEDPRIGVAGYGEGGLIAFYSAACDPRIDAALVSGYFGPREEVWREPIYRNVFGLLEEFGDAEIASLIAPRGLVIEHCAFPAVEGPPPPRSGRSGAAPGKLSTPPLESVLAEVKRAEALSPRVRPVLVPGNAAAAGGAGSPPALIEFLAALGLRPELLALPHRALADLRGPLDPAPRQRRQVEELTAHTQKLMRLSEYVRRDFWKQAPQTSIEGFEAASREYRRALWEEVIGRFPDPSLPASPRSRRVEARPAWTSHEVVLDVWPDVFAWGLLLVPSDLKPGERRPVVVCQHGLEGVPADTVTDDQKAPGFGPYRAFAARLAERGFITFAPHNPYRGGDRFRVLQRKANPLKRSLFSVILAQHQRITEWLSGLEQVDPERIGFYGLSYGGKTAVRVPPLLDRYALSICSADFNEWIKKNVTTDDGHSYMFTGEYEMPEFDLGHTFNYAELAGLMAPRPFMVERGHRDGVAPDEWVAYEFAKVRRLYAYLGIADRAEIEFFNGPHAINGQGSFRFLHRHLRWPEPPAK